MTPSDRLHDFKNQMPLRVDAKIVRSGREGKNVVLGLEFQDLTRDQTQRLEACFDYFNKEAHYQAA